MKLVLSSQNSRLLPLVSLRYLLAIWIFIHHVFPIWWMPLSRHLGGFITGCFTAGYLAVPYFFLLSGFVLALGYGSAERMNGQERKRFWIRRFSRIAPAFYAGLFLGLFPYMGIVSKHVESSPEVALGTLKDLFLNMSFFGTASQRALTLNYSGWTISVEALFYVIFPFLAPIVFRLSRPKLILTMVGCFLFCLGLQLTVMHFHQGIYLWRASEFRPPLNSSDVEKLWRAQMMSNPIFHIGEFVMGVALARLHLTRIGPLIRCDLPLAACLGTLIAVLTVLPHIPYLFLYNWLLLPVMALSTYLLTNGRGKIVTWLSLPGLQYVSESSYVLYILHTPARDWMSYLLGYFGMRGTYSQYIFGLIFVAVYIVASIFFHYQVNLPVTRAVYRFLKTRFLDAPATAENSVSQLSEQTFDKIAA